MMVMNDHDFDLVFGLGFGFGLVCTEYDSIAIYNFYLVFTVSSFVDFPVWVSRW